MNLRRRVDINGVSPNLWFGSGIHYALEMMYNPVLRRDPVEAFKTWYQFQWYGGHVTAEWLERLYDAKPILVTADTYSVRGLQDLLPDPNQEEFDELLDLGIGMLTFFKDYAERNDDFKVVAAESMFSVPLGFMSVDTREQSPNYGKSLEVHARGKRDAILYWEHNDTFGLTDYKSAGAFDEDLETKLDTDPQCSTYIWATQYEGKHQGHPWADVDNLMYQVLRKVYPKPPTILKNGTPSVNRTEESTTAAMFEEYVRESGLTPWFNANAKAQGYYTWLLEIGDANFIKRRTTYRNKHEIVAVAAQLRMIAEEMLDPNLRIYPHFTNDFSCTRCQFRVPCIAAQDGSDYEAILADGYERNRGR
jgi:hypothetical protein